VLRSGRIALKASALPAAGRIIFVDFRDDIRDLGFR
jgi:hypothetical protein